MSEETYDKISENNSVFIANKNGEKSGINISSDGIDMWAPPDHELIRFWNEDREDDIEPVAYIDGEGDFYAHGEKLLTFGDLPDLVLKTTDIGFVAGNTYTSSQFCSAVSGYLTKKNFPQNLIVSFNWENATEFFISDNGYTIGSSGSVFIGRFENTIDGAFWKKSGVLALEGNSTNVYRLRCSSTSSLDAEHTITMPGHNSATSKSFFPSNGGSVTATEDGILTITINSKSSSQDLFFLIGNDISIPISGLTTGPWGNGYVSAPITIPIKKNKTYSLYAYTKNDINTASIYRQSFYPTE